MFDCYMLLASTLPEVAMRPRTLLIIATTVLSVGIMRSVPGDLMAQTSGPPALGGVVSSKEEGPMEGVVVNARRDGANFTVSVVSDAQGKYNFPRTHLAPGKYTVTIRAVGYDLTDPGPAEVKAGRTSLIDLKLQKSKDLASQLSSLEWAMSIPGTTDQKDKLVYQTVSCAYCHNWQRVMKSTHTADEFVSVMNRMQTYYTDGSAVSNDGRGRGQKQTADRVAAVEKNANWGNVPKKDLAEYLATMNLSGGRTTWPFELKTLPRPKGKATRVIITQYDMPRPDTV
jgi:virginiamycin B lyase